VPSIEPSPAAPKGPLATGSRWRTLRSWASHVGVGLLAGHFAFLAVEVLSVLLVPDEILRGNPARIVLAIAVATGAVVGWCCARRFGALPSRLPRDAGALALLVLWFAVGLLGEFVVAFLGDPELLVHPPSGG